MFAFLAALVPLIPSLAGLFGDKAEKVAERVVPAVQALTGATEPAAAVEALKANPALLLDAQRLATEAMLAVEKEETERLRIINATMQNEANSKDKFVRRMRPTFGYLVALVILLQTLIIAYVAVMHPSELATTITAMSSMSSILLPALAVLGVYVYRRSGEKGAGGPLDAIAGIVGKRK
ncbi:3TM-type holin [Azospirillum sp.]|uniref:3TM-type holin n=1 Tax=Azospirillum sp. TaxID=34012 RepID=UPI003D74F8B5